MVFVKIQNKKTGMVALFDASKLIYIKKKESLLFFRFIDTCEIKLDFGDEKDAVALIDNVQQQLKES